MYCTCKSTSACGAGEPGSVSAGALMFMDISSSMLWCWHVLQKNLLHYDTLYFNFKFEFHIALGMKAVIF